MERYRPRWPLLLTLIAGVVLVVLVAYFPSREEGEARPALGGTYIEGVAGAPDAVNPLYATFNEADADLSALVFSGLVRLGPQGGVEADLAESYQVTPDGLTYIFELRSGLTWHDGEPLTSNDVAFTVGLIRDPGFDGDPSLAELFQDVTVEAPDLRTVTMTLPRPFAPFLARGATVGILPQHLLRNVSAAELADAPFNVDPVGSGPFRLTLLSSTQAILEPYEDYHFGRPFLDRFEARFYRDSAEVSSALLEGDVAGALLRPGVDPAQIAAIDDDTQLVRRPLHTTTFSLVYLNPRVGAFTERNVRQALQHGLDRAKLIAGVLDGQALELDSPIVRDLWSYTGAPESYAFDAELAASLLDSAGWVLEDGVRQKDGQRLSFRLAASDDPVQSAVAEEIAAQWRALGIEVGAETSGASQFVENVLLPRAFDAALVSVDPGPDPDPYPLWHSSQILGEGRNLAGFSDPGVDRLLENARLTTTDAERESAYGSFQEIFEREVPAVLLFAPTYEYVVRTDVRGLSPGLLHNLSARFNDVQRWFIETSRENSDGG
jgi:peptide/nickel transport system substrate-binding protein